MTIEFFLLFRLESVDILLQSVIVHCKDRTQKFRKKWTWYEGSLPDIKLEITFHHAATFLLSSRGIIEKNFDSARNIKGYFKFDEITGSH